MDSSEITFSTITKDGSAITMHYDTMTDHLRYLGDNDNSFIFKVLMGDLYSNELKHFWAHSIYRDIEPIDSICHKTIFPEVITRGTYDIQIIKPLLEYKINAITAALQWLCEMDYDSRYDYFSSYKETMDLQKVFLEF